MQLKFCIYYFMLYILIFVETSYLVCFSLLFKDHIKLINICAKIDKFKLTNSDMKREIMYCTIHCAIIY